MNTAELRKIMGEVRERMDFLSEFLSLQEDADALDAALGKTMKCAEFKRITSIVADHFGVTRSALIHRRRLERLSIPRQIAMVMCYEHSGDVVSIREVAEFFDNRFNKNIVLARKHIADLRETEPKFDFQVRMIEEKLKAKV